MGTLTYGPPGGQLDQEKQGGEKAETGAAAAALHVLRAGERRGRGSQGARGGRRQVSELWASAMSAPSYW